MLESLSSVLQSVCNLYQEGDEEVIQCNIRDISERRRAEEALRHSEKQYRDLFNSIDEGFCVVEMIFDQNEKPVDYRFLEVNPSFERQTGLHDVIGKRMRELRSDHEDYWFETYGKIAKTGEAMRFVYEAKSLGGRWFDVYAFRLNPHQDEKIGILFQDISERLKTEQIRNRLATQLQEELTDTQRLQETSTLLIQKGETQSLYEHILAAGVSVMRSDN